MSNLDEPARQNFTSQRKARHSVLTSSQPCIHSHQCRRLLRGHMIRHQTVENLKARPLFLRQCHTLHSANIFA